MYLILDAIHDLWRVLHQQHLPEERVDRYTIMIIVLVWTIVASVTFVLGIVTWQTLVGTLQSAHPVVAVLLWLSWPAIAVGGSLLTYRHIHRRELANGPGQVTGMREQVPEADRDLADDTGGTTIHSSGYEVGDETLGRAENLEVNVSSGGIPAEAAHEHAGAVAPATQPSVSSVVGTPRPKSDAAHQEAQAPR